MHFVEKLKLLKLITKWSSNGLVYSAKSLLLRIPHLIGFYSDEMYLIIWHLLPVSVSREKKTSAIIRMKTILLLGNNEKD